MSEPATITLLLPSQLRVRWTEGERFSIFDQAGKPWPELSSLINDFHAGIEPGHTPMTERALAAVVDYFSLETAPEILHRFEEPMGEYPEGTVA